ncbi:MAG: GGDEF domain-containing protein [Bacteriovoracaceae bacterium]
MGEKKYTVGVFGLSHDLTLEVSDIVSKMDNVIMGNSHVCESWEKFPLDRLVETDIALIGAVGYLGPVVELLGAIKKQKANIEIILINFAPNYSLAIKALRFGVRDLLHFPNEKETLPESIKKSIQFIENVNHFNEHNDNLYSLVYTDDVTGLYNQRKLFIDLDQLVYKANSGEGNFALMFIDIDNFKSVNDNKGHIVGSLILNYLAKEFRKILRETDLIYRYGGDEFIVIVEDVSFETAKKIAERILNGVMKKNFHIDREKKIQISISIGLSMASNNTNSVKEIIEKADNMMYQAKKQGKGTVCVWKD